jgi:hypothetical protein
MAKWVESWESKRPDRTDDKKTIVKYVVPRKKRYEESSYNLDESCYYMKCPGCEYIVLLPRNVIRGIQRKDDKRISVWDLGKNDSKKLDLPNVVFDSNTKRKHAYKAMQQHITKCEGCSKVFLPDCFGKRQRVEEE